jgi:hypothetical protein
MIRIEGEAADAVSIEITERALNHIKGTERWLGFLTGAAVTFVAAVLVLAIVH